jgi:hypothetical protein
MRTYVRAEETAPSSPSTTLVFHGRAPGLGGAFEDGAGDDRQAKATRLLGERAHARPVEILGSFGIACRRASPRKDFGECDEPSPASRGRLDVGHGALEVRALSSPARICTQAATNGSRCDAMPSATAGDSPWQDAPPRGLG